eukprot:TRINITY_DN1988_c0_g1_i6.p1 TRINITY_DN1988_c0_g1~~TRINITY_DN1988_c0_g1_i6.p1  ORF type:complete len:243 (-),score=-14.65 TRINITY_DN1988_c0_g1_i6:1851-2579(-)
MAISRNILFIDLFTQSSIFCFVIRVFQVVISRRTTKKKNQRKFVCMFVQLRIISFLVVWLVGSQLVVVFFFTYNFSPRFLLALITVFLYFLHLYIQMCVLFILQIYMHIYIIFCHSFIRNQMIDIVYFRIFSIQNCCYCVSICCAQICCGLLSDLEGILGRLIGWHDFLSHSYKNSPKKEILVNFYIYTLVEKFHRSCIKKFVLLIIGYILGFVKCYICMQYNFRLQLGDYTQIAIYWGFLV